MEDSINKKINFLKAPSTENMVCRLVSEDGKIEMGVWPVIFGFRVRAGYVGSWGCEIDWCCGAEQKMLEIAYSLCRKILEDGISFKNMMPHSHIKPFFKDADFMQWLSFNIDSDHVSEKLPPLYEIRSEYMKILDDFRGSNETS